MLLVLQVLAVMLVSVAMALALAHALELPGKLRLPEETYRAVQQIYYPGFTFGGLGEGVALLLLLVLLFVTPHGQPFWFTLAAFVALAAMHATYWLLTHPVNKFWVKDIGMGTAGARFFGVDDADHKDSKATPDWKALRDRWEYSHVVRAILGLTSEVLLVIAIAV